MRVGRVSIGRRIVFISIAVVVAVGLLMGGAVLLRRSSSTTPATSTTPEVSTTSTKPTNTKANSSSSHSASTKPTAPDPSTVKQLEIAQLNITLDYTNALPGMSYSIGRTAAGTTFVQLANDQLIGDKCTGDEGVFATILKNPSSTDSTTVSATVKVGIDTYGLALPSDSCTGDQGLFDQYQTSMKQNFPFLTNSDTAAASTSDTTQ